MCLNYWCKCLNMGRKCASHDSRWNWHKKEGFQYHFARELLFVLLHPFVSWIGVHGLHVIGCHWYVSTLATLDFGPFPGNKFLICPVFLKETCLQTHAACGMSSSPWRGRFSFPSQTARVRGAAIGSCGRILSRSDSTCDQHTLHHAAVGDSVLGSLCSSNAAARSSCCFCGCDCCGLGVSNIMAGICRFGPKGGTWLALNQTFWDKLTFFFVTLGLISAEIPRWCHAQATTTRSGRSRICCPGGEPWMVLRRRTSTTSNIWFTRARPF